MKKVHLIRFSGLTILSTYTEDINLRIKKKCGDNVIDTRRRKMAQEYSLWKSPFPRRFLLLATLPLAEEAQVALLDRMSSKFLSNEMKLLRLYAVITISVLEIKPFFLSVFY
ncbi:hypothetical protein GQX74_003442 [Glossina fuscipes]|nr:hypothetical protein GQX74_003442 [Glossina fuscipes]